MVKGNISKLIYHVHYPSSYPKNKKFCDNEGNIISSRFINFKEQKLINTKRAFLLHFRFKSTEEFVKKIKRGYSNWHGNRTKQFLGEVIGFYFMINKITLEKINYIEKELNINLLSYKRKFIREKTKH